MVTSQLSMAAAIAALVAGDVGPAHAQTTLGPSIPPFTASFSSPTLACDGNDHKVIYLSANGPQGGASHPYGNIPIPALMATFSGSPDRHPWPSGPFTILKIMTFVRTNDPHAITYPGMFNGPDPLGPPIFGQGYSERDYLDETALHYPNDGNHDIDVHSLCASPYTVDALIQITWTQP